MDALRVLRPLEEERAAIERLATYRAEAELADALLRVRAAVEQSLRLLLRADPGAPEAARLTAMAPELLPTGELIATLRRLDRISLELAGRFHALAEAVARASAGQARAGDADTALAVVRQLTLEVTGAAAAVDAVDAASPVAEAAAPPRHRVPVRTLLLAGLLLLLGGAVWWGLGREAGPAEQGVAAFRAGQMARAESLFLAASRAHDRDAGLLLYLGRIYRRERRYEEAANALRRAVEMAPADPDVRRELGWLFLELGRPEPAAEQFRRAQELAPAEASGWIGLIRSFRAAGSPEADEWLARAPAEVRAAMTRDSAAARD
jgi:tetratricopeptide (TPR) repeat protein